jgi:hypothetical protein
MLITGIFLSYMLVQEEDDTIIINQPIFAQLVAACHLIQYF